MFLVTSTDKVEDNNMTFKDLYDEFRMHNDEIMKDITKYGYAVHLPCPEYQKGWRICRHLR